MPTQITIQVEPNSFNRLQKKLDDLANSPRLIHKEIDGFSRQAVTKMKRDAPFKTGKLEGSIRTEKIRNGNLIIADSPYAVFVEYGTRYSKPTPFFFKNVMPKDIARRLRRLLYKILK